MAHPIYILVINHKHGSDITAYQSEESALEAVWDYCEEWWEQEFSEPKPKENLVQEYFALMIEKDRCENFEIRETELFQ